MTPFEVADLSALEILDSRGRPTLAVTVTLADGTRAKAGVPSGASTGSREAAELRDGDKSRYEGRGVLAAVANVDGEIADLLRSRAWGSLADADEAMISLDGTMNKSRLGANAMVGTSMALARALAASANTPLWQWLAPEGVAPSLPVPHFNVLNGGAHASNDLDFQEFMIAPARRPVDGRGGAGGCRGLRGAPPRAGQQEAVHRPGRRGRLRPGDQRAGARRCGCSSRPSATPGTRPAPRECRSPWTQPPRSSASRTGGTGWPANCSTARS